MLIKTITCLFIVLGFFSTVSSKEFGPDVSVYRGEELKWEDGAYGYFVMFKSMLKQDDNLPHPLTCMDEKEGSTYTLNLSHIPADASVERAFLVWTGAQPVALRNGLTDNEVTLSFISENKKIKEEQVITGKKGYKIAEPQGFEFDAFVDSDYINHSYFTYRVDITDFFHEIQKKGNDLGNEYDGYSLSGNYTLSDLTCAKDSSYVGASTLVAGWSIIMIYTSKEISPKKIYLYDGFKPYWHELSEINVTGFEFPTDPEIRITLAVHEGDPNLVSFYNPDGELAIPEGIEVQGDQVGWIPLSNECNPETEKTEEDEFFKYVEVFNSISSQYGWADVKPTCVGGIPPDLDYENIEYSMDVDTFVMDSSSDGVFSAHFNKGGSRIGLRIGANQDSVITNFMVVSVDSKAPVFDIPDQHELIACTPANFLGNHENYYDALWCYDGPHTFAIKIQNWGDNMTPPVIVKNTIPEHMEYVPGSTEYAAEFTTVNDKKVAKRWIKIPDSNGNFPLTDGFKIADTTTFCPADSDYLTCENLIMVRYKTTVKPGTAHMERIENIAEIHSPGLTPYKTNHGIPFSMVDEGGGNCVNSPEMIDMSECGGYAPPEKCKTDLDCESYEYCDHETGKCMPYPPPPDFDRHPDNDTDTYTDSDSDSVTDDDKEISEKDNSFNFGCSNLWSK